MICAYDIDLRKIYGVTDQHDVLINGLPGPIIPPDNCHLVLCEIAEPSSFLRATDQRTGAAYQLARWACYNVATCATVIVKPHVPVLVSPSSKWTRGFPLAVRHRMAGIPKGWRNKDLREARAMIWFHKHHPSAWCSLQSYLDNL